VSESGHPHEPTHGDAAGDDAHDDAGRRAFSQALAHDLRAPLRSIDSFAALLAQQAGDAFDDTARGYLQRIRDAAARMGALVDGLQDYEHAGRAELRCEVVDLSLLAEWAAAELQDAQPTRAASVAVAPGLAVLGDERWLKALLSRLLHNAWKFSASRERVEIAVEGERSGDRLRVRVRDRGVGFDPAYADKLFVPFQRLHGVDEGAGAGLGLATARRIARRHGGELRLLSAKPEGCVFEFELPAAPADAGTPHG
jgi:signal transduction histidine kinase